MADADSTLRDPLEGYGTVPSEAILRAGIAETEMSGYVSSTFVLRLATRSASN